MLTDYHLHLRPDDQAATFELFMTTANVDRYRAAADKAGIAELGVSEHIHRFRQALAIWDHPMWVGNATDDLDAYVDFVRHQTDLRLGIEMDYLAGREQEIGATLDQYNWDYVVGSVHFLGDGALDYDVFDIWALVSDAEDVWQRYFDAVAASARTGLYDIIAHPDLVKYWGDKRPRPAGDLRRFYEPVVAAFVEADVAVELSTAGLRKPVAEVYPAPEFLAMCVEAKVPVALSSDAHIPEDIGFAYGDAVSMLRSHGVEEIAVFENRKRRLEPLPA
ncbi:MAG: histidinol-phosphatase [Thermoleophilaceae bacterium]|nr:histidinol-phosphatase [Thermoleophilaceae bacterium]